MWNLLYAALILTAGPTAVVRPVSGPSLHGELVGISPEAITLQTKEEELRLELPSLWEISFENRASESEQTPAVAVQLVDGSVILATQVAVVSNVATIQLTDDTPFEAKTRSIGSVRFHLDVSTSNLEPQWQEILATRATSDMVVIRREASLDQLEGRLHDISADAVQFEVGGRTIDAKRSKLDGIVYYHPIDDSSPRRLAQLVDVSGSKWNIRSLAMTDDGCEVATVSGLKLTLPIARIRRIDFSAGNTVWLDELQPTIDWQPYIGSVLPRERLAQLFAPRFGAAFDGGPLRLAGQAYDRGMAVWSRTELTYRLTDEFRRLRAVVGIADAYGDGGNVLLTISGDDRELFSQTVDGRDEPLVLDLDISGVRRLRILVDFGGERDMRDHLNICDARITK